MLARAHELATTCATEAADRETDSGTNVCACHYPRWCCGRKIYRSRAANVPWTKTQSETASLMLPPAQAPSAATLFEHEAKTRRNVKWTSKLTH